MKSSQRRHLIQAQLDARGRVSVVDLAAQFRVAQETIRRDLAKLEESGIARKVHGGAVSSQNKFEETLVSRLTQNIPENQSCDVCVVGGLYDGNLKSNTGPMAVESIQQFYADFTITGTGGVDPKFGFSLQYISEATTARAMIARGGKVIVLDDPSKFNKRGIAHMADFTQVDTLVSSAPPDQELCRVLKENNVNLVTSEEGM